jgi:hypothetical protein
MVHAVIGYGLSLLALVVGVGALLAGEYFHGVETLVPVGGVLALLAVGGITLLVSRAEPDQHGAGNH